MRTARSIAFRIIAVCLPLVLIAVLVFAVEMLARRRIARSDPAEAARIAEDHPFADGHRDALRTDHRGRRLRRDPIPFEPLVGWHYGGEAVFWGLKTSPEGLVLDDPGDPSAFAPGARLRIVVLGGSTVAGAGASANSETIPAHLEGLLEDRLGVAVDVVNAGMGGWIAANELAYLVHEVLPFQQPDLVLVLDGYNDSWRAARAARLYPERSAEDAYPVRAFHRIDPAIETQHRTVARLLAQQPGALFRQWLASTGLAAWLEPDRYYLYHLLRRGPTGASSPGEGVDGDAESPAPGSPALGDRECRPVAMDLHPYLTAIRSSAGAALANGTPMIHALQPSIAFKEKLHPAEIPPLRGAQQRIDDGAWRAYGVEPGACFLAFQRRFFESAEAALVGCRDAAPARFHSLARLFEDETRDVFYDYAHYTDRGNRLIARALLGPILEACPEGRCRTPAPLGDCDRRPDGAGGS